MPAITPFAALEGIPAILNSTLVGNSTVSNSTSPVANPEVHSKLHGVFDAALGIGCVVAVLFMLIVLYTVTHMEQTKLLALKATICDQKQKLKGLRKLRKKNEETRRMLNPGGDETIGLLLPDGDEMRLPRVGKPVGIGKVVEGGWSLGKLSKMKSVKGRI